MLLGYSCLLTAQKYPVTSISINLPDNPDANTENWVSGKNQLSITAVTKAFNGLADDKVQQSKISVTLKKDGIKQCGSYTSYTVPSADFTATTKTWSGTDALALLGGHCILPEGKYQLCVQFLDEACRTPLSEEQCRSFTIVPKSKQETKRANVNYHHPELIFPANGTNISEADAKSPIKFSWTPVVPDPEEQITYRIRIWQIGKNQTLSQAMQNQPFYSNDLDNLQTITVNSQVIVQAKVSANFAWIVQSLDKNMQPIGDNNGTSDPSAFSIVQAGCIASLKVTSDSCIGAAENGMYKHRICVTYTADPGNTCNILFNSPTNNTSNNFGMFQSGQSNIFCSRTPGTSTANYSPTLSSLPVSLTPGASTSFCFDLLVPVSYTGVKFTAFGFCDDNSGNFNTANANDSITLKQCVCDACKEMGVTIINDSLNIVGGNGLITGTLSGLDPNVVKKVTMELVYFNIKQTGDQECAKCAENPQWGNFIPPNGSALSGFANPVLNGSAFGREWTWISSVNKDCSGNVGHDNNGNGGVKKEAAPCSNCPGGSSVANQTNAAAAVVVVPPGQIKKNSFSLPIALPPASSLACCSDVIMVCIRYTWWDFCCHACDIVKCYRIERKP